MPPKTLKQLGIVPTVTIVFADGEDPPKDKQLRKLRERALRSLAGERPTPTIPILPIESSPFLHTLKVSVEEFQEELEERELHLRGDEDHDLLRVADAGYYNRDSDEQQQHEDDTRRSAAKCSYFNAHSLPNEHLPRLMRKGQKQVSDHKARWQQVLKSWARVAQHYVFAIIKKGMLGLIAIYTYEIFVQFSEDQIRAIVRGTFRQGPVEHAMAMWAKLADTLDVTGIYRIAQHSPAEERRRKSYRDSIEYRFVEICVLVWKYLINVDPTMVDKYKHVAFKTWKKMTARDKVYKGIMKQLDGVGDVPVQRTTDQGQNLTESLFHLKSE